MTDKEILTALENALEFWQGELSRATRLEVIQFRKGDIIKYEPAKGMPGYAESMASDMNIAPARTIREKSDSSKTKSTI